jgi:adenine-specific DNA-methyltransferase
VSTTRFTAQGRRDSTLTDDASIILSYPGKRSAEAILHTSAARLCMLWSQPTPAPNRLYFGENLGVLATLQADPAVRGKVRLIYIDPPYASGGAFLSRDQEHAYTDTLSGPVYVEFIRERLILLHDLLAADGSIYVHLDDYMAWPIKVVMDEVFGPQNYRSWITRKKCNPKNYTSRTYGNVSDFILFYTKSDAYVWHRPLEAWTPERILKEYQFVDEQSRRHKRVPIHAPGVRNGTTGGPWRGMLPPPGKHWQYVPSTLDELDARGDIYWSKNGNPRRKVYFDGNEGVPVQDIWLDCRDVYNQNTKITGYPTEKPPALLRRIIEASSDPGDLVLDCFAGSGTTLDVAAELGRRWIGVDSGQQAITTILRRFRHGLQPMGDFVSERKKNAAKAISVQLSLIDSEGTNPTTERVPINDFVFMAEESLAQTLPHETLRRLLPEPRQ